MGRKNMMHLSVCREKRKKKMGRRVLLAVFLPFAQAIFQRSLYLYTTTSRCVVKQRLLHVAAGKVSQSFLTPGRDFHFVSMRPARVQIRKKKKMCRKGHSTTLTKQPFSISVLCYSNHCSHVRSIFNVWKRKKKKRCLCHLVSIVCLWLVVKKNRGVAMVPLHPSTSPLATQTCT